MSYYSRARVAHVDGTNVFQTPEDARNEREVADLLAAAWRCEVSPFGALCPVDWYAQRHGRLVGVMELKARPHASTKYPTVYLNVRKWLALSMASLGLGCPAVFVVRLTDGVFWTPLAMVEPSGCRVAGCMSIVKSRSDIEPIIEVRVAILKRLRD